MNDVFNLKSETLGESPNSRKKILNVIISEFVYLQIAIKNGDAACGVRIWRSMIKPKSWRFKTYLKWENKRKSVKEFLLTKKIDYRKSKIM